jgi:hypothetical protein
LSPRLSNYDKRPVVSIGSREQTWEGWHDIAQRIGGAISAGATSIAIECYPGVFEDAILQSLESVLRPTLVVRTSNIWKDPEEIERLHRRLRRRSTPCRTTLRDPEAERARGCCHWNGHRIAHARTSNSHLR